MATKLQVSFCLKSVTDNATIYKLRFDGKSHTQTRRKLLIILFSLSLSLELFQLCPNYVKFFLPMTIYVSRNKSFVQGGRLVENITVPVQRIRIAAQNLQKVSVGPLPCACKQAHRHMKRVRYSYRLP